MKSVFHIFYKLRGGFLEAAAKKQVSGLANGAYRLPYKIPYISQYESREFAARYVMDDNLLSFDPLWRNSGAETIDEYIFWAPKLCGMACFKIILLSLGNPVSKSNLSLVSLGKKAMETGCYQKDPANPKRLIGMLHKPFLRFAEQYGLRGQLIWYIGANMIAAEILKNNFVIASVSNQIRHIGARPENKQGHLVLVHGFQVSRGKVRGFYIHNPSGFFNESQENHFVPIDDFIHCFSGRIIVLLY